MILEKTNPALNVLEEIIKLMTEHIASGTAMSYDKLGTIKTTLLEVKADYIASNEAYIDANSSVVSMETLIDLIAQILQTSTENSENLDKTLTILKTAVNGINK